MCAVILLAVICLLASASGQSHDLVVGKVDYGDLIIYKTLEEALPFPFIKQTSIVDFPPPGWKNRFTIKGIFVEDHYRDGTGGYPSITAGGAGQKYVRINLESQRSYGFNFTVTIYGNYYAPITMKNSVKK